MALLTLKDIYKKKGNDFIEELFKSYVVVTEQIDGSRFMFQKHFDDSLVFYKRTGVQIGHIDRTLMSFYEKGIKYISGLDKDVLDKIPDNWTFGFKYFPSLAPINIVYDRLPKNHLILTDISVRNDSGRVVKVINDPKVLKDWASMLDVEQPPIIFEGYLSSEQKDKIKNFLEVNDQDLTALFKSESFTRFIISILNPKLKTTALSNSIDKDIEGIVFKFIKPGETEFFSAKVIDPIFNYHKKQLSSKKQRVANDMYQIAMLDIVEFIEQQRLDTIILSEDLQEQRYVELISTLFNEYVATNGHKYVGVDFDVPDFAKRPEFNVNVDNIKNSRTKEILDNDYMRNLFKIMLSSFRSHRKNPTDILTSTVIDSINNIVDGIESKVKAEAKGNVALDFDTFMKQKKYSEEKSMFEEEIFEGITVLHPEHGLQKVNIVTGRYQPFTNGHVKVFQELHKKNGFPVVVCIVRGSKPDPERNPFPEDLQLRMFASLQKQFKFLEAAVILPTAGIDKIYNTVRPAYEPVLWGAGTDRVKSYEYAAKKYAEDLDVLPEFKIYEVKRMGGAVSATKVREALSIEDKLTFNKLTPKSLHKFFLELSVIMTENAVIVEQNINESNSNDEYFSNDDEVIFNEDENAVDPDWMDINESERAVIPSASELADVLSSGRKFADSVLAKIGVLLGIEPGAEEDILNFLKSIQIPDRRADEMMHQILTFPNSDKFTSYMNNRKLEMNKMLDKKVNLIDIFTSQGLNKNLVKWLIEYRWPASPVIGPAEIALAVLVDGGMRPAGGQPGDLLINNTPIEVKGTGGRLRGQHGYGSGRSFKVAVVDALRSLSAKKGLEPDLVPSDIAGKDDKYYNFTRGNWGVEIEGKRIIRDGNASSKDIAEVLALGMKALYHGIDLKSTARWVDKYIKKDGTFDQEGMMKEFFIVSFEYYASIEDFTHIMITDSKGNVATIKNSDFRKNVGKTIKYGVPNFGDRAGQQGMAFSIALK